jgi:tetratricopeptide (TPR) repeat protein
LLVSHSRAKLLISLVIILITLVAFGQIKDHDFINLDDTGYVTENIQVQSGLTFKGVVWAFTDVQSTFYWHPVTWLSHMLDCQLYGLNPRGHHLTNLVFHILNALLVFLFFMRVTQDLWPSALVALLFALHPLHVESVAWVAERKDVLSTFFWMGTMFAYVRYVEHPSLGRYLLILLAYLLGFMSKPMVVTLPLVLLLLDFWPLKRFSLAPPGTKNRQSTGPAARTQLPSPRKLALSLVREKAPLLVLTGAFCLLTLMVQRGSIASAQDLTLPIRLANALVAYVVYLVKMVWPFHLAAFYPHPGDSLPLWQVMGAGLLLGAISYLVIRGARLYPYLATGWFWYLGTMVPVSGLAQSGFQAMADRFTYIPLIGIFMIIAWGACDLTAGWRGQKLALGAGAGVLITSLTLVTWFQVSHWYNSETLFKHALRVTENNYMAYNCLGAFYKSQGRLDDAIGMFQESIHVNPLFAKAYYNLGLIYNDKEMVDEAISMLTKAIEVDPFYENAYNQLGIILGRHGKTEAAIAVFQEAIRRNPDSAVSYYNLGKALANHGDISQAITRFRQAIQLEPTYAKAYVNLGVALAHDGKIDEAIVQFQRAADLDPNLVEAHNNLGLAYERQGKIDEAIAMFQKAIKIKPDNAYAQKMLNVLSNKGN